MDIKSKMNTKFRDLQGGLFLTVTKADVGEGAGNFQKNGGDIMAWADPFFPDPSIPDSVKKALMDAVESGIPAHYVMPIGMLELRQALAEKIHKNTGLDIDPSRNVIVTPGSDSGLLYSMMPFICEGDEVMVPDPSYPSNFLNPKLLGGVTVPVPLYEEDNYQIRIEEFEKRVTPRTKLVLITHPNNPTTTVFRRESIEKLCEFVIKHDLILVSDQAFEDHIYDGIEFVHPATLPGMWERTLTVCSISKGLGFSGFRIGYIYANDRIMDVLYGGAVNVLGAASTLGSIGAVAAVKDEEYLKSNYVRLERRRRLAYEVLSTSPGVKMKMSESGILSWLDISALGTAEEVSEYIMKHANIMVNQG
ncbi:MAG: pyridoxal phosphate-dependent aminotransferase, partial [Clostridia bacterium]|nr:pyridoxal phosphate-dependent aminotransferase [Clostridia bacterium]